MIVPEDRPGGSTGTRSPEISVNTWRLLRSDGCEGSLVRRVILALRSVAAVSNVRTILTPDPPPILYHYTTPAGLLGIIDKREIWASHTQYLNDQREFQHAVSIIEEEIASMKKTPQHDKHQDLLDQMASVLKDSGSMNVCVCSFSEKGDVLSQWRAYGGGSGFSIGLSGPFLRRVAVSQRFCGPSFLWSCRLARRNVFPACPRPRPCRRQQPLCRPGPTGHAELCCETSDSSARWSRRPPVAPSRP